MNNVKNLTVKEVPVTVMKAAKIKVLADPVTLLVFGAIVVSTPKARLRDMGGSTLYDTYISLYGLEKDTSLPQDLVKKAVQRLKKAGLLETIPHGHGSWRANEIALVAALV